MQKPIEVGKGELGYYVFPKDWTVKEGLNRQQCIREIRRWHKRFPTLPVIVISGTMNLREVQGIIDEALSI